LSSLGACLGVRALAVGDGRPVTPGTHRWSLQGFLKSPTYSEAQNWRAALNWQLRTCSTRCPLLFWRHTTHRSDASERPSIQPDWRTYNVELPGRHYYPSALTETARALKPAFIAERLGRRFHTFPGIDRAHPCRYRSRMRRRDAAEVR